MARLSNTSFELNNIGSWDCNQFHGTVAPVTSSTQKHSGTYSMYCNCSNDYAIGDLPIDNTGVGVIYARMYIYVTAFPTGSTCGVLQIGTAQSLKTLGSIYLNSNGKFGLAYWNGGTYTYATASSATVSLNTWHYIELKVDGSGTNTQVVTGKLDGVQFDTKTGTGTLAANQIINVRFGVAVGYPDPNQTCSLYIDDVAINDANGSYQNSWPGPGTIERYTPSAAGDVNTFATQTGGASGSSNNFTRVSEITPDDATTYNGSSTLNQQDMFKVSGKTLPNNAVINCVTVGGVFRNSVADATAAFKFQIEKKPSGTIASSASKSPNSASWAENDAVSSATYNYPLVLYKDPDGLPWTPLTISTMQIGYILSTSPATSGYEVDISTVWAYVDYHTSSTTGNMLEVI